MAVKRTIVLLRHAKSAWGLDVPDHERPLSKRGRRDSIAVAEHLLDNEIRPDLVWCSTALRSRETWERAEKAGAKASEVSYDDHLYEAVAHELMKVLRKTPDEVHTVLMIGHSPGIPDLVEKLAPRKGNKDLWNRMDTKYPTSGLATLSYRGDWPELAKQSAELLGFDVPRGKKPS
ncbi:SixA phosphatase family protein [Microlunatus soli]|uniref:Phosphohistidine phosphatase n=1 Tax=Microlunatus soli TaxID=630515 RepID=A0A1H1XIY4_9ACTN|nr:histidine phosphatase family protein [Microlunatus soli]SDT09234.1 phosphohistidine phosphatase [Microlunatus soli]